MRVALEARPEPSRAAAFASPALAVLATLLLGFVLFSVLGKDPWQAMHVFFVKPLETRLVGNGAMAVLGNRIRDRLAGHTRQRRFARGVNIGNNDVIGVVEGASKLVPQRLGAGITMRLEHGQDAFASGRARGRERGADLGRMMRIIVDEEKTISLIFDLTAAAGMAEGA